MSILRRWGWIPTLLLGVAFIVLGAIFIYMGADAKARITSAMADEQVTTGDDASIPGVPVLDAETAAAQEEMLKEHTLGRYGPYTGMERGDPNRDSYVEALTLRNSLNIAIMGFGVGDLAMGTGGIALLLGILTVALLTPVSYFAGRISPVER